MKKGFTLFEMLIVVAILGVVTTMAFPDFVRFFQMQEEGAERSALLELQSALELYGKDNGELPDEATWVADLAPYTHLSEGQIEFDVRGEARDYFRHEEVTTYRAMNDIEFHYGVIVGAGDDRTLEAYAVNSVADYTSLEPINDDVMAKYTDRRTKVESYETTLERLSRISEALSNYSAYMQNEELAKPLSDPNADQWIYYPPSTGDGAVAPVFGVYSTDVGDELDVFMGGVAGDDETISNDTGDDAGRRDDMEVLMRMLGLPEDHCCSAVELGDDGAPEPFFYYSNPRPRNSPAAGDCAARPGLADRKLPPSLGVVFDDCG